MQDLTSAQLALQARACELAQNKSAPTTAQTDQTQEYPRKNIELLRDAGLMGMTQPKSVGGQGLSYLKAVLSGDKPAISISEPNIGSAAHEMATRADKKSDHYLSYGEKYWITGGGVSKLHLIFAHVFDDGVEQGIGGFICLRNGEGCPEGLVIGRRLYPMSVRGIPKTHIEFRDLQVHKSMFVIPPGGAEARRRLAYESV